MTLLPDDAFAVVRLDLVQVRESPYYGEILALLRGLSRQIPMGSTDFVDVIDRTDEVVAGMGPGPRGSEDPSLQLFLRGRYGEDELERVFRALEAESAEGGRAAAPLVVVERAGHRVFAIEEIAAASLGAHSWLFTAPDSIDVPLARADGRDPGLGPRGSGVFRDLAVDGGFDRAALGVVVVATPALRSLLVGDRGQQRGGAGGRLEEAIIEAVVGAAGSASFAQGVDFDGFVETTNPLVAAATADVIEELLVDAADEPMLAGLVEGRRVTVEGPRALLSLRVEDQQVRELLAGLAAVLALLAAMEDAGEEIAPEQVQPGPDDPSPVPGQ